MISTVTLNPAIDRLLFIDRFEKSVTARIREKAEALGGKGVHISINLCLLGEPNNAFGILFGDTGEKIEKKLQDMGVRTMFVHGGGDQARESRTNYVVIEEDGASTIISDKGPLLSDDEVDSVLELLLDNFETNDYLVLSGDASNVSDPYVYGRFIEAAHKKSGRVFVDASGETLAKSLPSAPFLIKPNRDELEYITGIKIHSDVDAVKAINSLGSYGIGNIALSLGAEGSIVKFGESLILRAQPVEVPVKNTAGCGDAFLAGLIKGFAGGRGPCETLRLAAAVSAATAASPLTVGFDAEYAEALYDRMIITEL